MADIKQFPTANGVSATEAGLVGMFPNSVELLESKNLKYPQIKSDLIEKFNEVKQRLFSENKELTKQEFDNLDCRQVLQRQTDFANNVLSISLNILDIIDIANPKFIDIIKTYFKVNGKITLTQVVNKLNEVNNSLLINQFGLNSNKVSYGVLSVGFASVFGGYAGSSGSVETNFSEAAITDMVRDGYRLSEIIVVTLIHETIHRVTDFGQFSRANPKRRDVYKEDEKEKFVVLTIEEQLNNPDSYSYCFYDLYKAS